MNRVDIVSHLQSFVSRELLKGDDVGLDGSTPLLELGLIDSISLVMLQNEIAEKWNLKLTANDMVPENLQNLEAIADVVIKRLVAG